MWSMWGVNTFCALFNFSEHQHCLGNCFLGSRNAGNGVSEYSILKISWGSMPPDPPRCLRLQRLRGALRHQENIHVRCFHKYVRYFTKQLKTLTPDTKSIQLSAINESINIKYRVQWPCIQITFKYWLHSGSCITRALFHDKRVTASNGGDSKHSPLQDP